MTHDDIIKMAEQCGLPEFENNESQADNLVRFFHMARAAEREACAKVCDDHFGWTPRMIGETIRARGQA